MVHNRVNVFIARYINRLWIIIGIGLCSNLVFGQNSLSLDYFKRINTCAATQGFNGFSKGGNQFIFGGSVIARDSVAGCVSNDSGGLLILTDENANIKWTRCYPEGTFYLPSFGKNGTIWAAGFFDTLYGVPRVDTSYGLDSTPDRMVIVKLDSLGIPLWYSCFGSGSGGDLTGFIATSDGGALLLTDFNQPGCDIPYKYGSNPFYYNAWLCKLDSAGRILWSLVLGGSGGERPESVKESAPGIYTVLINTASTDYMLAGINFDSSVSSPWILKIDTTGHILSSKVVQAPNDNPVYLDFTLPGSNSVILAGIEIPTVGSNCSPGIEDGDFIVVETDTNCQYKWCAFNGGTWDDYLYYTCTINDSLIVAGGISQSIDDDLSHCASFSNSDYHAWLGLYNLNQRKKVWSQAFCGSGDDEIKGLSYDSSENALFVLISGTSTDGDFASIALPNSDNMYLLKYTPVTTGIDDITNEDAKIKLYPNPANDLCNLQITGDNKTFSASVFDVTGREVKTLFTNQLVANFSFSVENLPSGIYCLRISDEQGDQVVKKLVVQR
jgi:Secretion system C-terminal sorting domain